MWAEYVIWALQHLCLPECAVWYPCCHVCCSLEGATGRNGISWCHQASLMSPVLAEWQSSAMLQEGICLVIHVLNTGRNSLGKDGWMPWGECGWSRGLVKFGKDVAGCLQTSQGGLILPLSEAHQIMADSCRLFLPIPEWCLYWEIRTAFLKMTFDWWLTSQDMDWSNSQTTWGNYPLQLLLKGWRLPSPSKHCFP